MKNDTDDFGFQLAFTGDTRFKLSWVDKNVRMRKLEVRSGARKRKMQRLK